MKTRKNSFYQKKKHLIVEYIAWHWKENGRSPGYKDIAKALAIPSKSTVGYYIKKMSDENLIEINHGNIYPPELREALKSVIVEYWKYEKKERKWKSK